MHKKNLAQLKEVVKPFSQFSEVYNRYYNAQAVEIVVTGRGWAAPLRQTLRAHMPVELHPEQAKGLEYEASLFYLSANRVGPEALAELNRELKNRSEWTVCVGIF